MKEGEIDEDSLGDEEEDLEDDEDDLYSSPHESPQENAIQSQEQEPPAIVEEISIFVPTQIPHIQEEAKVFKEPEPKRIKT